MMRILTLFIICAGAANTQNASPDAYRGQSWVGLLVTAACDKGTKGHPERSKTDRESDLTVTSRTTTPAVDQSGTRGSSTALEQGANTPSDKGVLPGTGDVLSKKSSTDRGWAAARRQGQSLAHSCVVRPDTTAFALLLPDGSALEFDELANEGISHQLPSLPAGTAERRVLRVFVQGKLQNGKIALDSVRM
jgi:hypothetical protein